MHHFIEEIEKLIIPVVLAIAGGAAGYAIKDDRRKRRARDFIFDLIIWIYTGVICFYILENFPDLSASWKSVIISFSGFSAREILIMLKERFIKMAREKIEDKDK